MVEWALTIDACSWEHTGHTDGRFTDKTECPENAGDTVHCRVLAVYLRDSVADSELWLVAAASITNPGKDQNSGFKV